MINNPLLNSPVTVHFCISYLHHRFAAVQKLRGWKEGSINMDKDCINIFTIYATMHCYYFVVLLSSSVVLLLLLLLCVSLFGFSVYMYLQLHFPLFLYYVLSPFGSNFVINILVVIGNFNKLTELTKIWSPLHSVLSSLYYIDAVFTKQGIIYDANQNFPITCTWRRRGKYFSTLRYSLNPNRLKSAVLVSRYLSPFKNLVTHPLVARWSVRAVEDYSNPRGSKSFLGLKILCQMHFFM